MTQDEIEHMWKVASNDPNHDTNWHDPVVIAFAKLVAEKERDVCAEICENFADVDSYPDGIIQDYHAHLIRLRGKA